MKLRKDKRISETSAEKCAAILLADTGINISFLRMLRLLRLLRLLKLQRYITMLEEKVRFPAVVFPRSCYRVRFDF